MLTSNILTNEMAPFTLTEKQFGIRRDGDRETIYQLPEDGKASKDLATVTFRKKTESRNLNKNHSQQIIINIPWFTTDADGVSTLGGYENVTINRTSSAAASPAIREKTSQMISDLFVINLETGDCNSDDVTDFNNARLL